MVHISDLSWTRKFSHPSETLEKDHEVQCVVLEVNEEKRRISLGIKQLTEDPWLRAIPDTYIPGHIIKGKVTKITNFGAFVELEKDLEGLLHISELADHKIEKPQDIVKEDEEVEVKILKVDTEARKIGLSLRRAQWAAEEHEGEKSSEAPKPVERTDRIGVQTVLSDHDVSQIANKDAEEEKPAEVEVAEEEAKVEKPAEAEAAEEETKVEKPAEAEAAEEETKVEKPAEAEATEEEAKVEKPAEAEAVVEEAASEDAEKVKPDAVEAAEEETKVEEPAKAEAVEEEAASEDAEEVKPAEAEAVEEEAVSEDVASEEAQAESDEAEKA